MRVLVLLRFGPQHSRNRGTTEKKPDVVLGRNVTRVLYQSEKKILIDGASELADVFILPIGERLEVAQVYELGGHNFFHAEGVT